MAIDILDASSATVSIMSATVGSDQAQQIGWAMLSRSDTYTTTASGTAINASTLGLGRFALQCKQTGTVTSWTVLLEASLDGTNYVEILRHMKTGDGSETVEGDGAIAFSGPSEFVALYIRSRCSAVTLGGGTNVVATILGMP